MGRSEPGSTPGPVAALAHILSVCLRSTIAVSFERVAVGDPPLSGAVRSSIQIRLGVKWYTIPSTIVPSTNPRMRSPRATLCIVHTRTLHSGSHQSGFDHRTRLHRPTVSALTLFSIRGQVQKRRWGHHVTTQPPVVDSGRRRRGVPVPRRLDEDMEPTGRGVNPPMHLKNRIRSEEPRLNSCHSGQSRMPSSA